MATVGNIKAEVLLKFEGMEDTYSVGHLEIPVNVTTDEKRPLHATMRADTSGVARGLVRQMEGASIMVDGRTVGTVRNFNNTHIKENRA